MKAKWANAVDCPIRVGIADDKEGNAIGIEFPYDYLAAAYKTHAERTYGDGKGDHFYRDGSRLWLLQDAVKFYNPEQLMPGVVWFLEDLLPKVFTRVAVKEVKLSDYAGHYIDKLEYVTGRLILRVRGADLPDIHVGIDVHSVELEIYIEGPMPVTEMKVVKQNVAF